MLLRYQTENGSHGIGVVFLLELSIRNVTLLPRALLHTRMGTYTCQVDLLNFLLSGYIVGQFRLPGSRTV